MKEIINWDPEVDVYTKEGEIKLHETIHQIKFEKGDFSARNDRLNCIKKAEKYLGRKIDGKVLDIGCGNGYSSVHLAKTRDVDSIHALECDLPAVDKLIRANFKTNQIPEDKYELVLGSFNDTKNKSYYDFAISLGVIHHSGNLFRTLKSVYDSLKPGGALIAHEPFMKNSTPNSVYIAKDKRTKNVQGLVEIVESERDDHFFRECEYFTAAYHSGFDVYFKKVSGRGDVKNALLVLTKPFDAPDKIPHAWF